MRDLNAPEHDIDAPLRPNSSLIDLEICTSRWFIAFREVRT